MVKDGFHGIALRKMIEREREACANTLAIRAAVQTFVGLFGS